MLTEQEILDQLKQVKDPELRCNIVGLGLVYGVRVRNETNIDIDLTLTSMGCPAGPYIMGEIQRVLMELPGEPNAHITLVWDPPWSQNKIDPDTREELNDMSLL